MFWFKAVSLQEYLATKLVYNDVELIIFPDGKVMAAEPSHQECLLKLCMEKYGLTRDEMWQVIPVSCDVLDWMVQDSGCVSVWPVGYYVPEKITKEQSNILRKLILSKYVKRNIMNRHRNQAMVELCDG